MNKKLTKKKRLWVFLLLYLLSENHAFAVGQTGHYSVTEPFEYDGLCFVLHHYWETNSSSVNSRSSNPKRSVTPIGGGSTTYNHRWWASLTEGQQFPYSGSVTIPQTVPYNNSNYSVLSIEPNAFRGCAALTGVDMRYISYIPEGAFIGCVNLVEAIISYHIQDIGQKAFADCKNLLTVKSVEPETNNSRSFNAPKRSGYTVPITVSFGKGSTFAIGDSAFAGCTKLKTGYVRFGGLRAIGKWAFRDCKSLTSVTINCTNSIGEMAFTGCSMIKDVYTTSEFSINNNVFDVTTYLNASLHVPEGKNDVFINLDGWKNFYRVTDGNEVLKRDVGDIFIAKTPEGLEMVCSVIDASGKTCVVGAGNTACISTSTSGTVKVPDIIDGYRVVGIAYGAFAYCEEITNILLPSSIEIIDDFAFYGCTNLRSLSIPENVKELGDFMFWGCPNLKLLTVSDKNPYFYSVDNGIYADGLADGKNVTFLGWGCPGTIISQKQNVQAVGAYAFGGVYGLECLEVPNNIRYISGYAFDACQDLKHITISENIEKIMVRAFNRCQSLETITILRSVPIEIADNVFFVDDLDSPSFTSATLYVPAGSKTLYEQTEGWKQFRSIIELTQGSPAISFVDAEVKRICIENWDTNGDGELSEKEASVVTDLGHVFTGNSTITSFDELRYFSSLESIDENEFDDCNKLSSIVLPDALKSIGANAFRNCAFPNITIPASVTSIHYSGLRNCSDNFYVDSNNLSFCSIDGVLFSKDGKQLLTYPVHRREPSYIIPKTVTTIGRSAFNGCNLKSVYIPNGVINIESAAFRYCNLLESISIPNSVETIDGENFEYCNMLTTVTIPESVVLLGNDVFAGCNKLQEIIVDTSNEKYSSTDGILYNKEMSNLLIYPAGKTETEFVVPAYVKTIGTTAFYLNQSLKSITLHKDVENIYSFAFVNCFSLTSLTVKRSEPIAIGTHVFSADVLSNATLYVPYGCKKRYQEAVVWKDFGNIVESEEELTIVRANSYTREYGDDNPKFDYTSEGAMLLGTPSVTCSATKTSPVGTYDIVVSKGSVQNGNVTYVKGTLTITKAPLTVIADDKTMKEGDNVPELTVTYKGFKNGETESVLLQKPTVTTSANPGSPQGQYTISVAGAWAENYDPIYANGVMTVTKPDLITVTVKNCERGYGEQNPLFDYEVTGGALNGKPDMVCDAKVDSPVGTYEIRISRGSISYSNLKLISGVLTVKKAPLTVTADNKQMKQGEPLPELTFKYDGFMKWDGPESLIQKPVASTTAASNSAPGIYLISISGGEATNYDFIYKSGTLAIDGYNGSVLVVLQKNGSQQTYSLGDKPNVVFNGENLIVKSTTEAVTYKRSDVRDFYFGKANSAFEPALVMALNQTREYGDSNPSLRYESAGGAYRGNPDVSTTATAYSPVGTYPIIVSQGGVDNDNVTFVNGTLTISKAPLTVTADDQTMKQGEPIPKLTVSYSGFKNGETESVLLQRPMATTQATSQSVPGEYEIELSGGSANNYTLFYIDGILTVMESVPKNHMLVVLLKNGSRERFLLLEQPNALFVGSRLVIKTLTAGVVYERNDIEECLFEETMANNIEQAVASGELFIRQIGDERLVICGLNDEAIIKIYDLNGRLVQTEKSTNGCETEIQLPAPTGIYLINIDNRRTIKIQKR